MNDLLEKNGFLVIKNFITKKRAKNLSKEFVNYCNNNKNDCIPDLQVANTPAKYNYISFLELLCEKTPEISKIIKETVLPTYCYSRIYKKNDVLKSHTDRDACEVSLTIHLDGDKEWEIFLETPDKEKKSVVLNHGDALLYYGCTIPHWRDEYLGNYYSQVFLHYVKSKGDKSESYFDRGKDYFKNLEDYINVFENEISEELCDRIIAEYKDSDEWVDAKTLSGVHKKIRNCKIISLSIESTISKNQISRKKIDDEIYSVVSKVLLKLNSKYKNISISQDSGYGLLKYDEGGFYTQHTDNYTENPRTISCSICLNDDYEGGEFGFFERKLKYKLKKGSIITFPSNFMYPHEILPVLSGTRYSIITWFN